MSVHPNFKTGLPCHCGFGKYLEAHQFVAHTARPWEPGQWGKGIYFPDHDHLVTWDDERAHNDVWSDDEHGQISGPTHHLLIRPDGTVRNQGAFDRNFEDAEPAIPELAAALKRYDPRLKLDTSDSWDFGPTEPMEEEPSMSRGDYGDVAHGVQTGTDFAGGL